MTWEWLIASGLGTGFAPRAPGTAGSLLGLALGAGLLARSHLLLGVCTLAAAAAGSWAVRRATGLPWRASKGMEDDPGWVVIDEIVGQMLALLALPRLTWPGAAAAFVLFRCFDIAKPGPIGWADRQGGSLGIMGDDVLAGAAAGFVLLAGHAILKTGS